MNVISSQQIEETDYFIALGKIDRNNPGLNNKMVQQMLLKRSSREAITHQLVLFRNGKNLESTLNKNQLGIFNELVEKETNQKDNTTNDETENPTI